MMMMRTYQEKRRMTRNEKGKDKPIGDGEHES